MNKLKNCVKRIVPLTLAVSMLLSSVTVNAKTLGGEDASSSLLSVKAEEIAKVDKAEEIEVNEERTDEDSDSAFKSCRLIITSTAEMEFKDEGYFTDNIKTVTRFEDKYIVEYSSEDETEKAYNYYTSLNLEVEIDVVSDEDISEIEVIEDGNY